MAETWDALSRDQKIARLARGRGVDRQCPICSRMVQVVNGYWSQHTDQRGWNMKLPLPPCENELLPA